MAQSLSTGIGVLDQRLGGGFPAGSVVALEAPPASQVELLLHQFMSPRETLYLTLERTELSVSGGFRRSGIDTGDPTVQYVAEDDRIEHAIELIRELPEGGTLIVDPHTVLERSDRSRFRDLMNKLQLHVIDTGALAVLYAPEGQDVPALRDTTERMVDAVLRLRTDPSGMSVENRLSVPKLRGGGALTETLKVNLTDRVVIDTSRDIA